MEIVPFAECRFAPPVSWDGNSIRSAELLADQGNLLTAADLCDWLLTDDRLQGVLDTRIDTLLGFERKVEGNPHAIQLEQDYPKFFDESTWKQFSTWALLLNVALAERVWTTDPNTGREIPSLKVWNPRWLRYDWSLRSWMLTVGQAGDAWYGTEIKIEPNTPSSRWVMWTPFGGYRPWSRGLYRSVAKWSLLKSNALRGWAIHADKLGMGILVGTGYDGKAVERDAAVSKLKSLGPNGAVMLGKDADLKILESSQRTWENYKAQLESAENGFAVAVLGQDATTSGTSSSSARVLADVARGRIAFDAENSDTFVDTHFVKPWSLANWGTDRCASLRRVVETEDDRTKRASQAQMTSQAASTLKSAGANLDLDRIAEELGLPVTNVIKRIQDKIYQYHLEFGIMTVNEVRGVLGLPAVDGGDVRPVRVEPGATLEANNALP